MRGAFARRFGIQVPTQNLALPPEFRGKAVAFVLQELYRRRRDRLGSCGRPTTYLQAGRAPGSNAMSTLTLQEAARLLKIHPVTLQEKARAGEIPGAKIGRSWVFVEIDLLEHIRSQYRRRALQGEQTEVS